MCAAGNAARDRRRRAACPARVVRDPRGHAEELFEDPVEGPDREKVAERLMADGAHTDVRIPHGAAPASRSTGIEVEVRLRIGFDLARVHEEQWDVRKEYEGDVADPASHARCQRERVGRRVGVDGAATGEADAARVVMSRARG